MDLARLVWRNLTKHPLRTLLTCASLVVALFLLCTLRTLVTSLAGAAEASRNDRLWVQSAVSLFVDLPLNYPAKIEAVPGVESACKWQWFGAVYQDERNFFAQFAVDSDKLLELYPELDIVDGSAEAFLKGRQAALVGEGLVSRFGWKVGDRIPFRGALFPHPGGPDVPWEFDIAAVYRPTSSNLDDQTFFFHWKLFEETLKEGTGKEPDVGAIVLRIAPDAEPTRVMRDVDTLFENGPQRVQTTTEAEFQAQFVSMFGDVPFFVGAIGTGVLFAILLACANTMLMAAREQVHDVGILRSLGFSRPRIFAVLLSQSILLCGVGGGLGLLLAELTEGPISESAKLFRLPGYVILPETLALGAALTLLLGLLAGLYPAWRTSRVETVAALTDEA